MPAVWEKVSLALDVGYAHSSASWRAECGLKRSGISYESYLRWGEVASRKEESQRAQFGSQRLDEAVLCPCRRRMSRLRQSMSVLRILVLRGFEYGIAAPAH